MKKRIVFFVVAFLFLALLIAFLIGWFTDGEAKTSMYPDPTHQLSGYYFDNETGVVTK